MKNRKETKPTKEAGITEGSSRIEGNLEISSSRAGIFIGGDPEGLRSLARLLTWLANVDQDLLVDTPNGERCHVHIYAQQAMKSLNSLTSFSSNTELCRLDAKGTGDFPKKYGEYQGTVR